MQGGLCFGTATGHYRRAHQARVDNFTGLGKRSRYLAKDPHIHVDGHPYFTGHGDLFHYSIHDPESFFWTLIRICLTLKELGGIRWEVNERKNPRPFIDYFSACKLTTSLTRRLAITQNFPTKCSYNVFSTKSSLFLYGSSRVCRRSPGN